MRCINPVLPPIIYKFSVIGPQASCLVFVSQIKFSTAHPQFANATLQSTVLVNKSLVPLKVLASTVEVAIQSLSNR